MLLTLISAGSAASGFSEKANRVFVSNLQENSPVELFPAPEF
jgi:hypothetical protein